MKSQNAIFSQQIENLEEKVQNLTLESFEKYENIIISTIRKVNDVRASEICLGKSSKYGYITSRLCCQADEIFLTHFNSEEIIPIETNSYWIEDEICLYNTTDIFKINLPNLNDNKKKECSIIMYNIETQTFNEHEIEIEPGKCLASSCILELASELSQNKIVLHGLSISCEKSSFFGSVTKSKFDFIFQIKQQ